MSTAFLLLALKPPASDGHKRVHWWGTLTPHIGTHRVGAHNSSGVRAHHRGVQHQVRHVAILPSGVLPGHHAPSLEMSGYIDLPAALNGSHTNRSPWEKELAWPGWESLWHSPQGAHGHCRNQLKHVHPNVLHRSRCSLTSWARMILAIYCNCQLTWLASSNGLKVSQMSDVMLEVCLPHCHMPSGMT